MSVNLIDRVPVPGSFGVDTSTNVVLHIQTTGTVAQSTIDIALNGTQVVNDGAFRTGYTGTFVADGSGGWVVIINPSTNLAPGSTVTVAVTCVEQPGSVSFSQSYTFQTKRDVSITTSATYYEDGDVLEADVWVHEQQNPKPNLVDKVVFTLLREGVGLSQVTVDNKKRDMGCDGGFRIRLLHPMTATRSLSYSAVATIDPYQAPGVHTLVSSGTIGWESKTAADAQPGFTPAVQPVTRTNEQPNYNPSQYAVEASQQQQQAEHEVVDLSKSGDALVMRTVLVDLDFLNEDQYLQTLEGDLSYSGGGNRLLNGVRDPNDMFLQEPDELPITFGARTLVEGPATNLLSDSVLGLNIFSVTRPDQTVRVDSELSELCPGVNQAWYAVEGSVSFDGTERDIAICSPKVTITAGQPVLGSVLARVMLRDDKVTLDKFKLRINFWNNSNALVGSFDSDYDIFSFESDTSFSLMQAYVAAGSVPVAATKASFDVVIGSWEGCDLMNLWLAAPVIEHATFTTSRVVGSSAPVSRVRDDMRIQQHGNINLNTGRIIVGFAPSYDNVPPANVTLFDTRRAEVSGYTLRHLTSGNIELTAVDPSGNTQQAVSAVPLSLPFGVPVEITAQWTTSSLRVLNGTTVIAEFVGSYQQPRDPSGEISIGQKMDGTEPLSGEIHTFKSLGSA